MASDQRLSITVHDNLENLERLRPEWDALLEAYPLSTTFSSYEWLVPWWHAFGDKDHLQVLAFRDASSALVGLTAMAITARPAFAGSLRVLRLMGDGSHDSDNLDMPVHLGFEDAVCTALLDWMDTNSKLWDVCELNTLPAESAVGTRIVPELEKRGWKQYQSTRPQTLVELAETWETHLKGISAKERGKIGIRGRKLEKTYQVTIRRCEQESEIDPALQALFELHGKHWALRGLPGTLHSPARQKFYGELARLLLARNRLQFWILELNKKITAAQFGLRHGRTVFSLQEGFDPEYAADSVGYVLRSQVLKQIISEGVRRYDFLGGTDDSKLRWGGEVKHYVNLRFARPTSRGSFYLATEQKTSETKKWMRTNLPGAWKKIKGVLGKT